MEKYKAKDFNLARFFQVPKELFENPEYNNLSNEAKLLYSFILDRMTLSLKNKTNWIDEYGNVYCYYTNQTAQETLNRSERIVIKLKKELHQAGLLLEERQGLNKPNRIYPLRIRSCKKRSSGTDEKSVLKLTNGKGNDTEYNDTEYNDTEFGTSASAVGGLNTLFSIDKKDSLASLPTTSKLGEFNNLILENFGKQPTPLQVDEMRYLIEEHDLEVLKLAVKECVDNGKPYFAYMNTILNSWKHQGLATAELVLNRSKIKPKTTNIPEWSREHPNYKPRKKKILTKEEFLALDEQDKV